MNDDDDDDDAVCMFTLHVSVELWKNAFVLTLTVRYVRLRPFSIVRAGARDSIQHVHFCSGNIRMFRWTRRPVLGDLA